MWNKRWFVFAFNAFGEGCKHSYKALLAMGLAPTNAYSAETSLANGPETAQRDDASGVMNTTETYVLKGISNGCRSATPISYLGVMDFHLG